MLVKDPNQFTKAKLVRSPTLSREPVSGLRTRLDPNWSNAPELEDSIRATLIDRDIVCH